MCAALSKGITAGDESDAVSMPIIYRWTQLDTQDPGHKLAGYR